MKILRSEGWMIVVREPTVASWNVRKRVLKGKGLWHFIYHVLDLVHRIEKWTKMPQSWYIVFPPGMYNWMWLRQRFNRMARPGLQGLLQESCSLQRREMM